MIRRDALGSLVLFATLLVVAAQPALAATPDPADDPTRVSLSTLRPRIAAAEDDFSARL